MGAFQNIGMSGYLQRYGWKNAIMRGAFMANPVHVVRDSENRKILWYRKAKRYLAKHYLQYADIDPKGLSFGDHAPDNPVWVYWKQGLDQAPALVRRCIASVRQHAAREVILLSDDNVEEYVKLPDYVMNRFAEGKMSAAALSDLLRFSLLEHFGGTWIDATVLLTGPIPAYITDADFFAFQDTFGLIRNDALISTWLLHCKPANSIMRRARNMAFSYWQHENFVVDYLFTYSLLQLAVEADDGKEWYPYANSDYCHQYLNALDLPYSERLIKHIEGLSTIHKLTYKLRDGLADESDTVYARLMGGAA